MKKWTPLHHHVWRLLKSHKLEKRKLILCVSGGSDSMALVSVFQGLPIRFEVFHAHHGGDSSFRKQSAEWVREHCLQHKISLHTFKSEKELKSEGEMREFRLSSLKKIWKSPDVIVTAHHAQDLLETRLMRLIRGTGPEGLKSMSVFKNPFFRPFLELDSSVLKEYLLMKNQNWLEDPSNSDPRYLRNWIRHRWLVSLEKRQPGGVKRLGLSLENLLPAATISQKPLKTLSKSYYFTLGHKEQLQALAVLLKSHNLSRFTLSQLKEIQKRLDKDQKRYTFTLADAEWSVNAQRISLVKKEKKNS